MTRRSGSLLAAFAIASLSMAACTDDSSDGTESNGATNSADTTVNIHVSIQLCPPDGTNLCTFAGLPEADVEIVSEDNESLWSGTTNKHGDVKARIEPESEWTVKATSPLVESSAASEPFTSGEGAHVDLDLTPSGRYNLVPQSS